MLCLDVRTTPTLLPGVNRGTDIVADNIRVVNRTATLFDGELLDFMFSSFWVLSLSSNVVSALSVNNSSSTVMLLGVVNLLGCDVVFLILSVDVPICCVIFVATFVSDGRSVEKYFVELISFAV